jgi:hypothetical protein
VYTTKFVVLQRQQLRHRVGHLLYDFCMRDFACSYFYPQGSQGATGAVCVPCSNITANCAVCTGAVEQAPSCTGCTTGFSLSASGGACVPSPPTPAPSPPTDVLTPSSTAHPAPAPLNCPGIVCAALPAGCTRAAAVQTSNTCPTMAQWCNAVCSISWQFKLTSNQVGVPAHAT